MKSQEEAAALAGVDLSHLTEEEIQVFENQNSKYFSTNKKSKTFDVCLTRFEVKRGSRWQYF